MLGAGWTWVRVQHVPPSYARTVVGEGDRMITLIILVTIAGAFLVHQYRKGF